MSRPLCPHCYRESCPWLMHYGRANYMGPDSQPERVDCPLSDFPLAPLTRRKLLKRLETRATDKPLCTECDGEGRIPNMSDYGYPASFKTMRPCPMCRGGK